MVYHRGSIAKYENTKQPTHVHLNGEVFSNLTVVVVVVKVVAVTYLLFHTQLMTKVISGLYVGAKQNV